MSTALAQGALLAFWIVLTHAERGLTGFCVGYPHRMVDDDFWTLLDTGLEQIGDHDLDEATFGRLVATLERLDPEVMRQLDDEYQRILPGSLRLVAQVVRDHASEFVSIEA